jgi:hypothetical protein
MSGDPKRSASLAHPAFALQLLWEIRNEQRPAAEPQQPDEPIDNEPNPPCESSTTPPPAQPPEPEATSDNLPETGPRPQAPASALIIRPSGVDVRKLRPKVILHIHLSHEALLATTGGAEALGGGVGRLEGVGPITLGQVRRFLADTSCQVKVQPVIDPQDTPPVDSYEIPRRIKEAMFLRMPASCFPYSAATQRMDLDHTKSYLPPALGGPPRQTGVHTLGPLIRFEHRLKTHSRWQVRQPEPGVWIWRSPHHAYYLVSNAGTHHLGDGPFARRIWRAAAARPPAIAPA